MLQDAEKELLKLLEVLNEMPQGTSDAGKRLSAKFAECLGHSQAVSRSFSLAFRLAKAHSDCNSANNGALADVGWIVPGQSDKDFEAAAFDLPAASARGRVGRIKQVDDIIELEPLINLYDYVFSERMFLS